MPMNPVMMPIPTRIPTAMTSTISTTPRAPKATCTCDGCETVDGGEKWYDFGLDGVESTPQIADGGYDWGEGNGTF